MSKIQYPKFVIRRVRYVREEYQLVDTVGQRIDYVDPENQRGEIKSRHSIGKETFSVLEPPRPLTAAEAAIFSVPFEGEVGAAKIVGPAEG